MIINIEVTEDDVMKLGESLGRPVTRAEVEHVLPLIINQLMPSVDKVKQSIISHTLDMARLQTVGMQKVRVKQFAKRERA